MGELAAGAIAGVLSAEDAIKLTRVRGEAMAAACDAVPTGMTAVLGGDEDAVLAAIADAGLTPANINTAGQIVAGGTLEQLAAFAANPPAGARLRPLRVAGRVPHRAHGPGGRRARRGGRGHRRSRTRRSRCCPTATARSVTSGADWVERIVSQVAYPVRWDRCMATMAGLGVTALIELLPGGTLAGMAKRALPGVELLAIKTPDQLDAARALVAGTDRGTDGGRRATGHRAQWA